ncbi:MAG: FHIPEP family type III secretion protein [Pseudomonadota bacterium]
MGDVVRLDVWFHRSFFDAAADVASVLRAAGADPALRPYARGEVIGAFDADGIIPVFTASDIEATWIDENWLRYVLEVARYADTPVFGVRAGECAIPAALSNLSFADPFRRDPAREYRRLLASMAQVYGADRIKVPNIASETPTEPPQTPIRIRYGDGLAHLFCASRLRRFEAETVPLMRDGLFHELGVLVPEVATCRDPGLPPQGFALDIHEVEEFRRTIPEDAVFVNALYRGLEVRGIAARPEVNPATGFAHAWVDARHEERLLAHAFTTWDATGWIVLCTSAMLRNRISAFLGQGEVAAMLDQLRAAFPLLVRSAVPDSVSLGVLTEVLRRLVSEGVAISNLRRILISLGDHARYEKAPMVLTGYVRSDLKHQIRQREASGQPHIVVFLLRPEVEATLVDGLVAEPNGSWLEIGEDGRKALLAAMRVAMDDLGPGRRPPAILTPLEIRAPVRRLIAAQFPNVRVISYNDIPSDTTIQPVGRITWDGFERRAGVS